jgi:hypothetical protein
VGDNVARGLFHANGQVGKKRQNAGSPDYTKSCWIQNGGVIWSVSLVRVPGAAAKEFYNNNNRKIKRKREKL